MSSPEPRLALRAEQRRIRLTADFDRAANFNQPARRPLVNPEGRRFRSARRRRRRLDPIASRCSPASSRRHMLPARGNKNDDSRQVLRLFSAHPRAARGPGREGGGRARRNGSRRRWTSGWPNGRRSKSSPAPPPMSASAIPARRSRPSPARSAAILGIPRRAGHFVPDGQHVEVFLRRRDPQARGRGKTLPRRHDRPMAAAISGLEGREPPPPAQHDERHPELFRDRDHFARLGRRAHPRPDGGGAASRPPTLPARTTCRRAPATTIRTPITSSPA